jgi:hypothetical protein
VLYLNQGKYFVIREKSGNFIFHFGWVPCMSVFAPWNIFEAPPTLCCMYLSDPCFTFHAPSPAVRTAHPEGPDLNYIRPYFKFRALHLLPHTLLLHHYANETSVLVDTKTKNGKMRKKWTTHYLCQFFHVDTCRRLPHMYKPCANEELPSELEAVIHLRRHINDLQSKLCIYLNQNVTYYVLKRNI